MDEKTSKRVILAGYCVPYIFLCLYGDAVWGIGWIYGIAAAAVGLLCYLACKTKNLKAVIAGNVISLAVSEVCVMLFAGETLNHYYESFGVQTMIGICFVIMVLIQAYLISRMTDDRKRHKRNGAESKRS